MLSKFIAIVALASLMFLNSLGNFWFTYGIWPRSWWSFTFFWLSGLILFSLMQAVTKDKAA